MAGAAEPDPPPVPGTRAECTAAGGAWNDAEGRGQIHGCNPRTRDGEKACTDSDQCEGACQHGKCSSHRFVRGCGVLRHGHSYCLD